MPVIDAGKIELREEGLYWTAHVCPPSGERILLATIAIAAVANNPDIRRDFVDLVKAAFAQGVQDILGDDVEITAYREVDATTKH